jgi:hypothetical protein
MLRSCQYLDQNEFWKEITEAESPRKPEEWMRRQTAEGCRQIAQYEKLAQSDKT